MNNELANNILPFWQTFASDYRYGGFIGEMAEGGAIDDCADKTVVFHARMLWTYSSAYQKFSQDKYLKQAQRAYEFLINNFIDHEYGGAFERLSFNGSVINNEKDIISQAYVIYSLSSYYRASLDKSALDLAFSIVSMIEFSAKQNNEASYTLRMARDWALLNENETLHYAQVSLHLIEAYNELIACKRTPQLEQVLTTLLEVFIQKLITKGTIGQSYNEKWQLTSNQHWFGHSLEGAWLIVSAAQKLKNKALLLQCEKEALGLIDNVILAHEENNHHKVATVYKNQICKQGIQFSQNISNEDDQQRQSWVQAEALCAFSLAYELTGKKQYLDWLLGTWQYILEFIVNEEDGDWHFARNNDGSLVKNQLKIGPWKCPYHIFRGCLQFDNFLEKHVDELDVRKKL